MPKKTKQRKVRIALKLPLRNAEFIIHAQSIHDQMAANAGLLPAPNPVLTVLQSQIDDVSTAEAAAKLRTTGAVDKRDAAKTILEKSLNSERAYVEQVANTDPDNAAKYASAAGMTVRTTTLHAKPPIAVKGVVSGEVAVTAKATAKAKTNAWQYSTDGGKTWIDLQQTSKATTTIANLTPGTTIQVRHRAMTKTGWGDWVDPVSHVVA